MATYRFLQDHFINGQYIQAGMTAATVDVGGILPLFWTPTPDVDPVDQSAVWAYFIQGPKMRGLDRQQWTQIPVNQPAYIWRFVNGQWVFTGPLTPPVPPPAILVADGGIPQIILTTESGQILEVG